MGGEIGDHGYADRVAICPPRMTCTSSFFCLGCHLPGTIAVSRPWPFCSGFETQLERCPRAWHSRRVCHGAHGLLTI